MNGELSAGLARLTTAGNRIVSALTSEPVALRGVNRSGMEYSEPDEDGFAAAAGISRVEIDWIAQRWGANILRIPFNQDWALNGRRGFDAEAYLRDLDRIVRWAARAGVYTLLDLQWLDADHPFGPAEERQLVPPLPNARSAEMWAMLGRRYAGEPAVLFDIFNEPHDREAADPYPLTAPGGQMYPLDYRRVGMEEWQPWARALVDAVRSGNPDALVFVSGVNWGYDLRGFPLDRANLVYSTHVYRNKGLNWDAAFGDLARAYPVFAGEWGGEDADREWGRDLLAYFEERRIGWTAWSWADNPKLVSRYAPTRFGELVREGMRAT